MKEALKIFKDTLDAIERDGLTKNEKIITSAQGAEVSLSDGRQVINMCANNYLGLANNPEVIAAARKATTSSATDSPPFALYAERRAYTKSWREP